MPWLSEGNALVPLNCQGRGPGASGARGGGVPGSLVVEETAPQHGAASRHHPRRQSYHWLPVLLLMCVRLRSALVNGPDWVAFRNSLSSISSRLRYALARCDSYI